MVSPKRMRFSSPVPEIIVVASVFPRVTVLTPEELNVRFSVRQRREENFRLQSAKICLQRIEQTADLEDPWDVEYCPDDVDFFGLRRLHRKFLSPWSTPACEEQETRRYL